MNKLSALIITPRSTMVILDGKALSAEKSHPNYQLIQDAIEQENWSELPTLFDIAKAVKILSKGKYEISEEGVTYNGEPLHGTIERRLISFFKEGKPLDNLLKFHERLAANPSFRSVNELYDFLEHKNIPIGEDGCFYAYKAVRSDWMDIYTGRHSNHIGAVLEMNRNQVDDDANRHCSHGYHVGSLEYVKWYGREDSRYLIVKVDPADVVSVPRDHNCQKVRVCKYEVVAEYKGPLPETTWDPADTDDTSWLEDDYYDDWLENEY